MKKKPNSRSAFLNARFLVSLACCALGVLLALVAFALYPGGNALATQNESNAPAQQYTDQPLISGAAQLAMDGLVAPNVQAFQPVNPPNPNAVTTTFVVNTTADTQDAVPGDGVCADSGGACSLRAAITENNALGGGNTITLPAGTYTETLFAGGEEDNNAEGDFDIRAAVTINGAGSGTTFVQAAAAPATAPNERVFHITLSNAGGSVGTVNISDLTIRNGYITAPTSPSTSGAGAGLRIDATGTINFTNVILTDNRLSLPNNASGGGLIVRGQGTAPVANPTVTLTGCTISNNVASSTLSSVNGFAGGVYNQDGVVTLNNCTVSGNIS